MKGITRLLFVAILAMIAAACAVAQSTNTFTLTIPGPAPTQLNINIPPGTQTTLNGITYNVSGSLVLNPATTASIGAKRVQIGANEKVNSAVRELVQAVKPTPARS